MTIGRYAKPNSYGDSCEPTKSQVCSLWPLWGTILVEMCSFFSESFFSYRPLRAVCTQSKKQDTIKLLLSCMFPKLPKTPLGAQNPRDNKTNSHLLFRSMNIFPNLFLYLESDSNIFKKFPKACPSSVEMNQCERKSEI